MTLCRSYAPEQNGSALTKANTEIKTISVKPRMRLYGLLTPNCGDRRP